LAIALIEGEMPVNRVAEILKVNPQRTRGTNQHGFIAFIDSGRNRIPSCCTDYF
jgi:hypothetical protein